MLATKNANNDRDVFINCPFDADYAPLFRAAIFGIVGCRCRVRCALEKDNGGEVRFEKIIRIIQSCRLGMHDLSRIEVSSSGMPRFNMPLELGLFLGAMRLGAKNQRSKSCLILERERFSYQKFVSDLAGQDTKAHGNDERQLMLHIRNWLRTETGDPSILTGESLVIAFNGIFKPYVEKIGAGALLQGEGCFADYLDLVTDWWETPLLGSVNPVEFLKRSGLR